MGTLPLWDRGACPTAPRADLWGSGRTPATAHRVAPLVSSMVQVAPGDLEDQWGQVHQDLVPVVQVARVCQVTVCPTDRRGPQALVVQVPA